MQQTFDFIITIQSIEFSHILGLDISTCRLQVQMKKGALKSQVINLPVSSCNLQQFSNYYRLQVMEKINFSQKLTEKERGAGFSDSQVSENAKQKIQLKLLFYLQGNSQLITLGQNSINLSYYANAGINHIQEKKSMTQTNDKRSALFFELILKNDDAEEELKKSLNESLIKKPKPKSPLRQKQRNPSKSVDKIQQSTLKSSSQKLHSPDWKKFLKPRATSPNFAKSLAQKRFSKMPSNCEQETIENINQISSLITEEESNLQNESIIEKKNDSQKDEILRLQEENEKYQTDFQIQQQQNEKLKNIIKELSSKLNVKSQEVEKFKQEISYFKDEKHQVDKFNLLGELNESKQQIELMKQVIEKMDEEKEQLQKEILEQKNFERHQGSQMKEDDFFLKQLQQVNESVGQRELMMEFHDNFDNESQQFADLEHKIINQEIEEMKFTIQQLKEEKLQLKEQNDRIIQQNELKICSLEQELSDMKATLMNAILETGGNSLVDLIESKMLEQIRS